MTRNETVIPAYGRDYKTMKDVLKDFHNNKDFVVCNLFSKWDGKLCNKEDLIRDGINRVEIRYSKGFMGYEKLACVKL